MSATIRGPEPPFVGAVYKAMTKSGRRWEVKGDTPWGWLLWPMGDTGGFGGVKPIYRTADDLRDRKRWRMVGVTRRAANALPPKERS